MDPVTATSFAASILTFITFSSSLIAGAYEVYKNANGRTVDNDHINTIVDDLQQVADELEWTIPGNSNHEIALQTLAFKCKKLSTDILSLLESLKVSGRNSIWKSLKVKLASMRKAGEIAKLEKQLGGYRSEILLRLNLMMK
jgi:hypothetical protein